MQTKSNRTSMITSLIRANKTGNRTSMIIFPMQTRITIVLVPLIKLKQYMNIDINSN